MEKEEFLLLLIGSPAITGVIAWILEFACRPRRGTMRR
jgi:hypothetical protein